MSDLIVVQILPKTGNGQLIPIIHINNKVGTFFEFLSFSKLLFLQILNF